MLYTCKINEELLTLYCSQDAEMPALLLKGSWDVQSVKKSDVESSAVKINERWWWSGGCWPLPEAGPWELCSLLLLVASALWHRRTSRQSRVPGGLTASPDKILKLAKRSSNPLPCARLLV